MSAQESSLLWFILMILVLYILQGIIPGFKISIPIYLASYKASWQEQATFSWVSYPFSFRILWPPIIDCIYIDRFGRHLTWLVPIQLMTGIILLILSFYLEFLLINLRIGILTIIFFILHFLIASQDIVVDGWSVVLFTDSNVQWPSICQMVGQVIGTFLASTVLMTFESKDFTNKYIREPFSFPHRPFGLCSLQNFTFFWAIIFIVTTLIIVLIFVCKEQWNKIIR